MLSASIAPRRALVMTMNVWISSCRSDLSTVSRAQQDEATRLLL